MPVTVARVLRRAPHKQNRPHKTPRFVICRAVSAVRRRTTIVTDSQLPTAPFADAGGVENCGVWSVGPGKFASEFQRAGKTLLPEAPQDPPDLNTLTSCSLHSEIFSIGGQEQALLA